MGVKGGLIAFVREDGVKRTESLCPRRGEELCW